MSKNKNINILDRFKRYSIINNIIQEKIKNAENKCLYPLNNGEYTLNDIILLYKRIGSKSSYGSIFLSKIIDYDIYKFATKVQLLTTDTYNELKFLELVTKTSITNKNIHFPLMFNNLECTYFNKKDKLIPNNLKDEDNKYPYIYSYYSTFVELADGDLGSYLIKNHKTIKLKQINNILSQCFIAILSCHRVNILHNDAHLENFLYHKINKNKKSCFKYEYEDLVFYIENLGFNWVIWDFGYSKFGSMFFTTDFIYDYIILIYTIIEELDDNNLDICNSFIKKLFNYLFKFKNDYDLISFLLKNNILFSDKPIGEIITTIIL
jgi:serine/threonine protein kinase